MIAHLDKVVQMNETAIPLSILAPMQVLLEVESAVAKIVVISRRGTVRYFIGFYGTFSRASNGKIPIGVVFPNLF